MKNIFTLLMMIIFIASIVSFVTEAIKGVLFHEAFWSICGWGSALIMHLKEIKEE
jgi:uncharacterized membrane protein